MLRAAQVAPSMAIAELKRSAKKSMKNTLLLTIGLIAGFLVNLFLQTAPDPISLHSKDPEKIPSTAVVSAEIAQLKIEKKNYCIYTINLRKKFCFSK